MKDRKAVRKLKANSLFEGNFSTIFVLLVSTQLYEILAAHKKRRSGHCKNSTVGIETETRKDEAASLLRYLFFPVLLFALVLLHAQ